MLLFQFNIPLHREPGAAFFARLWQAHSTFPLFWLEEFADLDRINRMKLEHGLTKPLMVVDVVQWTMVRQFAKY